MKSPVVVLYVQICVYIVLFFAVAGCEKEQEAPKVLPPPATNEVAAATTLLATISDQERPLASQGLSSHAGSQSDQGQNPIFTVVFSKLGGGVAYSAQKEGKAYVVHNGKAGRPYKSIDRMALSLDGRRIAYGAQVNEKWRMVIDGSEGPIFDGVGEPVFSPDGRHVAYEAKSGEKWHIVVDDKTSAGCISYYDKPVFSADSARVFAIENTDEVIKKRFIVSDLGFINQNVREFPGNIVVVNEDKTRVAAVFEVGKNKKVIEFSFADPERVKEGPLYDDIAYLVFGGDGVSVAYTALKGGVRLLILNDKEERLPDGGLLPLPVIRPDLKGIGIMMAEDKAVFLHQAFYNDGTKEKRYDDAADLVYNSDGSLHAYSARKGMKCFAVVNGKEGPAFDMVISPVFSPDGRYVVYRARKDGKRFVVVADTGGKTVSQSPSYEQVFNTLFTSDGKSVAYGVKDGNKLIWKVEKLDK